MAPRPTAAPPPEARSTILVTGATGHQGSRVARLLLARGHRVRAMTRHPDQALAQDLEARGAEIVQADFEDRASVARAAEGADAAFLMATPYEAGVEAEEREGKKALDALKEAQVPYVLYSSVASADRDTGIPHFDSKRRIERHLMSLGIPHTIVGPVFFMENLLAPDMLPGLASGRLDMPMPGTRPLQMVALADLAEVFVRVLERRDAFLGRRFDVASDSVTPQRAARVLSLTIGRPVEHAQPSLDEMRLKSEDLATMWAWFDRVGYSVDIEGLHRAMPDVPWHTFDDWANMQDWTVLAHPSARAQRA